MKIRKKTLHTEKGIKESMGVVHGSRMKQDEAVEKQGDPFLNQKQRKSSIASTTTKQNPALLQG